MKQPTQLEQRLMALPANYPLHVAQWVWMLEESRARTKRCVAGLDQAVLDWQPPDGGNSIGTLLYHVMAIEMSYLYEDMLQVQEFPAALVSLVAYDVRDAQGRLTHVQGESLARHLERLDASRQLLLDALQRMSLEELRRVRQVEDYLITPECALHHLLQHEAEHRGQMMEMRTRAELARSKT
jgi:uncharacterized damage-inducible protein DinB